MKKLYKDSYPILLTSIFEKEGGVCDFCVKVKIGRSTFYEWLHAYPEFAQAYEAAQEIQEQWLTRDGVEGMRQGQISASVWAVLMRNKCGYTDYRKVRMDFSGCKTPDEKLQMIDNAISQGKLTTAEYKNIAEAIKTAAQIHEATELVKQVEELKALVNK